MGALERRPAQIGQNNNIIGRVQPLLITSVGAEDHYDDFLVDTTGVEMALHRSHHESWYDFEQRLDQLALEHQCCPLRILLYFPIGSESDM